MNDEKKWRGAPHEEDKPGERFFPREKKRAAMPRAAGEPAKTPRRQTRATVAIARTSERFRDEASITRLVEEALGHLGGIEAFVKPGQTVLIKPNQTGYFLADEGMTTDPRLVAALIKLAQGAGAKRVIVGESSGMDSTRLVMEATGMAATARAAGAEVVSFDESEQVEVEIPGGKALRKIALPRELAEADVILNACKGKTHHMDPISGAIKNYVGAIPLKLRMQHHDAKTFAEYVDIMSVRKPAVNICDAIIIGEGDGPVANTPRWCGCVLASTDPVALDTTICRLFSLDPAKHNFAAEAAERGLGTNDTNEIEIAGARLEEARIEVRQPRQGWDYMPFNVIVGKQVTYSGTLGHWKSIADAFLKDGTWVKVMATSGIPTFLIGEAEDPEFERHVKQGPYIVIDDAAPERYQLDPRVHFVPGHPALHNMLPEILKGLGLTVPGNLSKRAAEAARFGESRLLYVPGRQTAKEATVLGLAVLGAGTLAYAAWKAIKAA